MGGGIDFDPTAKNAARDLAKEFSETSTLLSGIYASQVPNGRVVLLVIDAVSNRAKSDASMRGIIRRVRGILKDYLSSREETNIALKGGRSALLLRDYL